MRSVIVVLALVAALVATSARSGASFVATTSTPTNTFATAPLFNTVVVSLSDPGSPFRGTKVLSATASSELGIASVAFRSSPAGANTYTTICTPTVAPYTCSWTPSDGTYDVQALATDTRGYTATSTVTSRQVDNAAPTVTMDDPGVAFSGSKTLTATASDGTGTGVSSLAIAYRTNPAGAWTPVCSSATSPASCSFNSTLVADGLYDFQATATDGLGNVSTSVVSARRVDNTVPTVTMTNPGTNLRAGVTLQSTSADTGGSGIAQVAYEYKLTAGSTWTAACTSSTGPFSCTWTTPAPDGNYDLRAIATDVVGKSATSAAVTSRLVDNTAPNAPTMGAVASPSSGTAVNLTATAGTDAGSGVKNVDIQRSPTGLATWTSICVDPTAPYACTFNSTLVADGRYDFRALESDNAGNTTASALVTNRIVDNVVPTVSITNAAGSGIRGAAQAIDATAADGSGIANVAISYKLTSAGAFTALCTDTTSPYSCPANAAALVEGDSYDLRAIATDAAGRTATSAIVTVFVDNQQTPSGTTVQGINGGTTRRIDAADTLTFTYSEPVRSQSIQAAWTGAAALTVKAKLVNGATVDTLEVFDSTGVTKLPVTGTAPLALNQKWVSAATVFSATLAKTGSTLVLTFGARDSGTLVTGVTGTVAMSWTPSASALDMASNPFATTVRAESGGADIDF